MTTEKNLCVVTGNLIVPEDVFIDGGAEKLLEPLKAELKQFVPDLSTKKSRAEIASFAAKFSKSKVLVDKLGKALKDEYSVKIKPIDKERKIFKDGCDSLRDEARMPLTLWEEEQERIVEMERQKVAFELDYEEALSIDDLFNRERAMEVKEAEMQKMEDDRIAKEQAEQAEKDRIAYEAKVKADAEEKAKRDAENAEIKRLADIQAEKDRAEQERQDYIAQQKRDHEESERLLADKLAKEKVIADRKAANMNHQKAVNNKVLKKLMLMEIGDFDILEHHAKKIIEDLVKNPIPEITINY